MFSLLNDIIEYDRRNLDKIKSRKKTLMQRGCIITGETSLRHLRTGIFHLTMDFKKQNQICLTKHYQIAQKQRKKRCDRTKNKVQNTKNNNLQARPSGKFINFIESNKLLQDKAQSKVTHEEALKRITDIRDNITTIINQKILNLNQIEVINILSMVDEIFTGKTKTVKGDDQGVIEIFEENISNTAIQRSTKQPNEQPDTTDTPDLESEESTAQRRN